MGCLDADVVQGLMVGGLDAEVHAAAVAHLDGCAACRELIGLATHDGPAGGGRTDGFASTVVAIPAGHARARAAALDQTGRVLGRYTLAARLGEGAMGVVYRADDKSLGRSVAVKLLHRPDSSFAERLNREARAMAQVNHPNVVAVYDVGVDGGTTYIAMELVAGGSLRAWQSERRSIPELIEAYIAAGRGLAAAHAAGIIHRDFKPDNVLVGADGRVRVTDFGLAAARAVEGAPAGPTSPGDAGASGPGASSPGASGPGASSPSVSFNALSPDNLVLTDSGVVLGTPAYMAPEQFTGGNVDPRTDQFNFCVALYEALYGARPFRGKTFEALGDNVCEGKVLPPPPGARVSRALRAIILRGLSVRPGDRYPTMDHLLEELGRDRARPWRRTSFVAAALAIVLGLGLGADLVLRDRVSAVSLRAFDATGTQVDRAFGLLAHTFDTNANQMYLQPAMRLAAAHRDQADFGLGAAEDDAENLEKVHSELFSTDWTLWSRSVGSLVVAVADYKGRLLYTTAAPQRWHADLTQIPWIAALAAGKEKTITLQRTASPRLAESGLLGPAPAAQLGCFFARTLVLNQERSGYLVQAVDARQLLDDIDLGDGTELAIADLEGVHAGPLPAALVAAAPRDGSIAEVRHAGSSYHVKAQPLTSLDGRPVGHVIMARELGGVLTGLFPGARTAFALAMLAALAAAALTAYRARRISDPRGPRP